MNITLSADKELIRLARAYAKQQNSTLNALIRKYLKHLVEEADSASAAKEFEYLSTEFAGRSPEGFTFNRNEIYDRNL